MQSEVITAKTLAEMFEVSEAVALDYICEIRAVSDTLHMKGRCHRQDYEMWLEVRRGAPMSKCPKRGSKAVAVDVDAAVEKRLKRLGGRAEDKPSREREST